MAKATLVSLANALGVSRQTISNAINAPERVKPETLARVQRAIAEAGYRPSAAARQLRTRRSMNLGIRMIPGADGINGSIYDRFLHSLAEAAQERGYRLTLFYAASDADEIEQYGQLLDVADLDGFVLTGTHRDDERTAWLLERGVPFAAFGRPWSDDGDPFASAHAWVDVDGGAGTEEATRALMAQGHRRIGFLGWPTGSGVGDDRRAGWRRGLSHGPLADDASRAAAAELDIQTEDGVARGADGAALLVGAGATAVVCASDSLALGALAALRSLPPGTPPPAVVGFDDTPVAAAIGLSSVAQPIESVARQIIAVLTHGLGGRDDGTTPEPPRHVLLPAAFVERTPHALGAVPAAPSP